MSYYGSSILKTKPAALTLLALSGLLIHFSPDGFRSVAVTILGFAVALAYLFGQLKRELAKRAEAEEHAKLLALEVTGRQQQEVECANAQALQVERANAAKSQFLANMSHEICTPMHQILGICHLLRQTGLAPKQGYYLGTIEGAATSQLGVINDVLDFSPTGQAPPRPEPEAAGQPASPPYLDMGKGIEQIGGSRELYMSLLHRFADEYGTTPDALESEIDKGNLSGAALIAQSVKGIAGVLAALPLQSAAAELERALPQGGKRVRVTLAGFRHELESVLGALPVEVRRCS